MIMLIRGGGGGGETETETREQQDAAAIQPYDDEDESDEEQEVEVEQEELFFDAVQDSEADEYDEDESEQEQEEDEQQDEILPVLSTDGIQIQIEVKVNKFDAPLMQNPMSGLLVSLGVMYLSRKLDLFAPHNVRAARWAFIVYLVILQAFVVYFRIQARKENNQTPIEFQNPLFTILQNRMQQPPPTTASADPGQPKPSNSSNGNDMVKNIASSFLSSKSTILEYDLQQSRSMQSGLLLSIVFQWLLHFQLQQIQPLIMATLNGLLALVYSPLFQVYVLGKNLERPFQTPAMVHRRQEELSSAAALSSSKTTASSGPADMASSLSEEKDDDEEEEDSDHDCLAESSVVTLDVNDDDGNDADEYTDDDENDTIVAIPHDPTSSEDTAAPAVAPFQNETC
jgi:Phosphate transport (Pho88)